MRGRPEICQEASPTRASKQPPVVLNEVKETRNLKDSVKTAILSVVL